MRSTLDVGPASTRVLRKAAGAEGVEAKGRARRKSRLFESGPSGARAARKTGQRIAIMM